MSNLASTVSLAPKSMHLPTLTECEHPIIKPLLDYSDRDLVQLFQQQRDRGQYFTALFCRYGHMVYTLLANFARSTVQVDYLFARTWRNTFLKLAQLDLETNSLSLQTWILSLTAACINQGEVPPVENIHYSLNEAPPPLWCYLEEALAQLPESERLMIVMAQTFHWSEGRIAAYLQSEGENTSIEEVQEVLAKGYKHLEATLPEDIQVIYLAGS
jgi:hypothetical protein